MRQGALRHRELHEEITDVVEVETSSREEHWGVVMCNAITSITQLRSQGICREIPLIGQINGTWVVGVADQIKRTPRGYVLSDHKTRKRPTMPSQAQQKTTHLQLMIYNTMYKQLQQGLPQDLFFNDFQLDPQKQFQDDLPTLLKQKQIAAQNLQEMFHLFCTTFAQAPTLSTTMEISYEWQRDNTAIGTDRFHFSQEFLQQHLTKGMSYWNGLRQAEVVPMNERWKCKFCDFTTKCRATRTHLQ